MFDITFAEIGILIQPKYFSTVPILHAHPISRIQTLVKVGHRVFNTILKPKIRRPLTERVCKVLCL